MSRRALLAAAGVLAAACLAAWATHPRTEHTVVHYRHRILDGLGTRNLRSDRSDLTIPPNARDHAYGLLETGDPNVPFLAALPATIAGDTRGLARAMLCWPGIEVEECTLQDLWTFAWPGGRTTVRRAHETAAVAVVTRAGSLTQRIDASHGYYAYDTTYDRTAGPTTIVEQDAARHVVARFLEPPAGPRPRGPAPVLPAVLLLAACGLFVILAGRGPLPRTVFAAAWAGAVPLALAGGVPGLALLGSAMVLGLVGGRVLLDLADA